MKNRKQKFLDFYACLQREYLVAELRYKIYERQKDKSYYLNKEMLGKKETIESMSVRNNLPSIFTDNWLMSKYKDEIYNDWGLPNFIYRSDNDRAARRPKDIVAFFHKGVEVDVKTDNGLMKGTVVWTDLTSNLVTVEIAGKEQTYSYNELRRKL